MYMYVFTCNVMYIHNAHTFTYRLTYVLYIPRIISYEQSKIDKYVIITNNNSEVVCNCNLN